MAKTIAEQTAALLETAGLRVRDDLALVAVRGDDATSWLNGQVTNDVRGLEPGEARYALAVTVRGKIIADLWIARRDDALCVLLPKSAQAQVLESFESQIIMEDVALAPEPATRVISIQGPRSLALLAGGEREFVRADELGFGGAFVLVNEAELASAVATLTERLERAGGVVLDERGWELARVRAGRARFGSDFGAQNYPQEAGLKALAVSFNKGCYLGQEVVCTLENRGRLTRRLVRLESDRAAQLETGAQLTDAAGHAVGQITSSAHDPESGHTLALGYVKSALAQEGTQLSSGETPLRVIASAGAD